LILPGELQHDAAIGVHLWRIATGGDQLSVQPGRFSIMPLPLRGSNPFRKAALRRGGRGRENQQQRKSAHPPAVSQDLRQNHQYSFSATCMDLALRAPGIEPKFEAPNVVFGAKNCVRLNTLYASARNWSLDASFQSRQYFCKEASVLIVPCERK
jgi:hypothetical protein